MALIYKLKEFTGEYLKPIFSDFLYGARWRAQTFTTSSSYNLRKITFNAYKEVLPDDLIVSIYNTSAGKPTGSAIQSVTIDKNSMVSSKGNDILVLFDYIPLVQGTMYAVVWYSPATSSPNGYEIKRSGSGTSVYPGGTSLTSLNSGSTWTIGSNDYSLRVYSIEEERTYNKSLIYRFYSPTGEYISCLTEKDFTNFPEFSLDINGGLSELRMRAAFSYEDWNYPPDGILTEGSYSVPPAGYTGRIIQTIKGKARIFNGLWFGNLMKMFLIKGDQEYQIYSGVYSGYTIEYSENGQKEFVHLFIPNVTRLTSRVFRSGTNTTVDFNSVDPSDMFRACIFNANVGITYTSDSVKDTGVSRTYSFVSDYASDVLSSILKITPNRWIYYIDGDDKAYLKNIDTHGMNHKIYLSQCKGIVFDKSVAFIKNRVLFLGGGGLYKEYNATASQNAWGINEEKIADERVTTEATASIIANRFLNERQVPTNFFRLEVLDKTDKFNGYDIETIKPGDTITVFTNTSTLDFAQLTWGNFTWGVDYWKYDFYAIAGIPGIVKKINYKYDSAIFECAFTFENQEQRIEDVNRDLTNFRFKDAPDLPS